MTARIQSASRPPTRIRRRLLVVTALTCALAAGAAACQGKKRRVLSGAEITSLFAGKTVRGEHDKRGYSFRSYYQADGVFRSYQGGKKTPRIGKWWTRGNRICVRWRDGSRDWCRNMVTDGKGRYWKVLIKGSGKRIPIVTFRSFAAGNPDKL
jgi:hypothetical protein